MISQLEQDVINSNIRQPIFIIEFLDRNENTLDEVTLDVLDGSMNFNASQNARRSVSLTLNNFHKKYMPSSTSKLWISNRFKIKAGYLYGNNQKLLYDQGVFLLGNPNLLSSPTERTTTIEGLDKWALLDGTKGGTLKHKLIIDVDTRVDYAVKQIVEKFENKFIIDTCDTILPYTIEKEPGTPISDVLTEICDIVSYECFYDNMGWLRFQKHLDPKDYQSTPSSWYYTSTVTPNNLYRNGTRKLNWNDFRNSIMVMGTLLDNGMQIQAEAKDLSDSDMSIDKIGEYFELIADDKIWDNTLAQNRANWELQKRIMVAEEVGINIHANFSHQLNDVVTVVDENNGTSGNYAIQNISYNIGYDTEMSLGLWAIRDWR